MAKTKWQTMREAKRKQQTRTKILTIGGISLAVIAVIAVIIVLSQVKSPSSTTGLMGDEVAVPSTDHVPTDSLPGPYLSNPPAGGAHYGTPFQAKFYQESDLASLPKYPQGYLVHNLEHGYVVLWYNCQAPNTDCAALKKTIQDVMDAEGGTKLIAFPWTDMDIPLAMTTWGRILKFPTPDPALMKQFIEKNRYQAPEPGGA